MIEFIYIVLISSAAICGVYLALDEDMVLYPLAKFVNRYIKYEAIRKPLTECITCMASVWGSGLYWLLCYVFNQESALMMWPVAVLCIAFTSTLMYGLLE